MFAIFLNLQFSSIWSIQFISNKKRVLRVLFSKPAEIHFDLKKEYETSFQIQKNSSSRRGIYGISTLK